MFYPMDYDLFRHGFLARFIVPDMNHSPQRLREHYGGEEGRLEKPEARERETVKLSILEMTGPLHS